MLKIKGVFPPAVTMFDKKGDFDWEANEKHADYLIASGVDGIAYFGTNGEFSSISLEDKKIFLKHMHDYVDGRVKIISGIGDTCIDRVLELLKFSEALKLDGVLLINPYFTVYADNMVVNYYKEIAKQSSLPIVIYNFPSLTGYTFQYDVVKEIIEAADNIVGLKDTIDNLAHLRGLLPLKKIKPNFELFCAFENQFLPALTMGIESFISSTGNFAPDLTIKLIEAYKNNNLEQSAFFYNQLMKAMEVYDYGTPLLLGCKEAVYQKVVGRSCFEKLPALGLGNDQKQSIRKILQELDIREERK